MATNGRTDESLMVPGIPTGVQGVELLLNGYKDGTTEVKNLLKFECDVIVECKICRNLFRSLPSFVSHKRIYCKESAFEQAFLNSFNFDTEETTRCVATRPSSTESCPSLTLSSCNKNGDYSPPGRGQIPVVAACSIEEKTKIVANKKACNSNGNKNNETVRNASKLAFNFLNRLVKTVEKASANPATYVPVHKYPEIHRVVPQVKLQNGFQLIKNPAELEALPVKERKDDESTVTMVLPQDAVHRQHAMELRTRRNFNAADTVRHLDSEEIVLYDKLSDSGQFDLTNLTCLLENCQKSFKTVALAVEHLENGHKIDVGNQAVVAEPTVIDAAPIVTVEATEFSLPSDYLADAVVSSVGESFVDVNRIPDFVAETETSCDEEQVSTDAKIPISINSREKRQRTVRSPYDDDYITSWPKRLKKSPDSFVGGTPVELPTKRRPFVFASKLSPNVSKTADASTNNIPVFSGLTTFASGQNSNLEIFPIVFTQKQKEQTLALMNEKEKRCRQCGALFTSKPNLERHVYIHLGFIRFWCTKCNAGAFYRTELRRHLRTACPKRKDYLNDDNSKVEDDYLNSLIAPVCPEEPGKVIASASKVKPAGASSVGDAAVVGNKPTVKRLKKKSVPKIIDLSKTLSSSADSSPSKKSKSLSSGDSSPSKDALVEQQPSSVKLKLAKSPTKSDQSIGCSDDADLPSLNAHSRKDNKAASSISDSQQKDGLNKTVRVAVKEMSTLNSVGVAVSPKKAKTSSSSLEAGKKIFGSLKKNFDKDRAERDINSKLIMSTLSSVAVSPKKGNAEKKVIGSAKKNFDKHRGAELKDDHMKLIEIKRENELIKRRQNLKQFRGSFKRICMISSSDQKRKSSSPSKKPESRKSLELTKLTDSGEKEKSDKSALSKQPVNLDEPRNDSDGDEQESGESESSDEGDAKKISFQKKTVAPAVSTSSSPSGRSNPLLKRSVKMFKNPDGTVMVKVFVPKVETRQV